MEKSDGFLRHSIPKHKTNNLFLRFIANKLSSPISNFFLIKSLRRYFKYEDEFDKDENFKMPRKDYFFHWLYAKLYRIIDMPYSKWGTLYTMDLDKIKKWYEKESQELQEDKTSKEQDE